MTSTATSTISPELVEQLIDQGIKGGLLMLWDIAKAAWPSIWPYVLFFVFILIGGVLIQIIMMRMGGHSSRLSGGFNALVGSVTNGLFFCLILFVAYQIWGTQVIDEAWFALIEAIAFPLTWIFLRVIGFWYY